MNNVYARLQHIQQLLSKRGLAEMAESQQELPHAGRHEIAGKLMHKRIQSDLLMELDNLHTADAAFVLESLPVGERLLLWDLVTLDRAGEILLALPGNIRQSLIVTMSRDELCDMAEKLDAGKVARLAPDLPPPVMREIFKSLALDERSKLRAAMSWPKSAAGAWMDFGMITIHEDTTLQAVLRYLHHFDALPDHTDQLFVIDRNGKFTGSLPLGMVLTNAPEMKIGSLIDRAAFRLHPEDDARQAARVFERYGLISAPVVDEDGLLIGRITLNAIMRHCRITSENELMHLSGLRASESIFAPVPESIRNRWVWLALNLCAALLVSRTIGIFENSISKLAALAALLPIVSTMARNVTKQAAANVSHALAANQVTPGYTQLLISKEFSIAILNGLVGGCAAGLITYVLYENVQLGVVMAAAVLISLLIGTMAAIAFSFAMKRLGHSAANNQNWLLDAVTDSGGFLIFLGLATLFLIR